MAAVARQFHQRAERRLEPLDDPGGADVAEVVRGERRQQLQADVGRRRAMRDRVGAIFLVVVGDQPVVGRREQFFEEEPGPPARPSAATHGPRR